MILRPRSLTALLLPAALAAGCSGSSKISDVTEPARPPVSDTAVDSGADPDTLPPDPTPFTLTVAGAYSADLTFDQPTCQALDGAPNFRAFWRNAAREHVFVLVADVLGVYAGPGTYDQTMGHVDVKLQEEAGGSLAYFASGEGDTVSIEVENVTDTQAWGSITVSGLQGDPGAITVSPQPIPIWCPELD